MRRWPALGALVIAVTVLIGCYWRTPGVRVAAGPGDGLVLRGFYALEASDGMTFRWSGEAGRVVLPQVGRPVLGVATLDVWFPVERPRDPVTITGPGLVIVAQSQPGRRTLHLLVPGAAHGGDVRLDLHTAPWQPTGETRALGVALGAVAWRGIGGTLPPWRQLWVMPALVVAFGVGLTQLRVRPTTAWASAGALGAGLSAAAGLLPLRVAPFTHWILIAVLLALVVRVLPRLLPRTLPGLAALQLTGYTALWAILHVAHAAPAFDNGWFTPGSRYVAVVEALSPVAWLLERPSVARSCFLVIIAVLSALYFWTLRCVRDQAAPPLTMIVALTLASALPLLFLPRLLSTDIYSYALYGRVAAVYGHNPFIARPDQFPQDQLFSYIAWTTTPSVYGPAWVDISLPLTLIGKALGSAPAMYVLIYKAAAVAAYVASVAILKRLLDLRSPGRALWGTLAFAWHPLVLIELIGSGHNDSVMILLVLVALLLAARERQVLAVVALVVAGMVKLVALALVPVYAMYTLWAPGRKRVWRVARQVASALAVTAALYAPYWVGPQTLTVLATAPPLRVMRGGPAAWVWVKLGDRYCTVPPTPGQAAGASPQLAESCTQALREQIRQVSLACFLVVYAALVLWPIRHRAELLDRAVWVLVAYTLLAAISFRAWYVTWVLALVPLMRRPRQLLLLWGCTIFLDYSRLPIWERNLLGFVPVIVLLMWEAIGAIRQINPSHEPGRR